MKKIVSLIGIVMFLAGCGFVNSEERERERQMHLADSIECVRRNDSIRMAEEREEREKRLADSVECVRMRDSVLKANGGSVPFEEFLRFQDNEGSRVGAVKTGNDSIIPYIEYDYSVYTYESWKGILVAIPKTGSPTMQKFRGIDADSYTKIRYRGYLTDLKFLKENFDLYVYYVTKDQLTNLNSEGEEVIIYSDEGSPMFDWSEKDDAIALVYHYVDGEWEFVKEQVTEGSSRIMAERFAKEVLKGRK